ncbi:MAG TPA: hypothetical protein VH138_15160 [Vicinamibacterales bacterium]|nr:hypothetical protein [Vicinamibacterales bacterium]
MNDSRFEFESGPATPDTPGRRWQDAEPREALSTAPGDAKDDDQRGDEEPDEPGYGHGV